jgi:hypothetical protein
MLKEEPEKKPLSMTERVYHDYGISFDLKRIAPARQKALFCDSKA